MEKTGNAEQEARKELERKGTNQKFRNALQSHRNYPSLFFTSATPRRAMTAPSVAAAVTGTLSPPDPPRRAPRPILEEGKEGEGRREESEKRREERQVFERKVGEKKIKAIFSFQLSHFPLKKLEEQKALFFLFFRYVFWNNQRRLVRFFVCSPVPVFHSRRESQEPREKSEGREAETWHRRRPTAFPLDRLPAAKRPKRPLFPPRWSESLDCSFFAMVSFVSPCSPEQSRKRDRKGACGARGTNDDE